MIKGYCAPFTTIQPVVERKTRLCNTYSRVKERDTTSLVRYETNRINKPIMKNKTELNKVKTQLNH